MDQIGAVILAAGAASRLGPPKQFVEYLGETLIRRAISAASCCRPVVVVAGSEAARMQKELRPGVLILQHAEWQRGLGSSIRAGVACALVLAPNLSALAVLSCDQPFVTADFIRSLEAHRRKAGRLAAASHYSGTLGVPAIFARPIFARLLQLSDRADACTLLKGMGEAVASLDFPEGAIDSGTPAGFAEWLAPAAALPETRFARFGEEKPVPFGPCDRRTAANS